MYMVDQCDEWDPHLNVNSVSLFEAGFELVNGIVGMPVEYFEVADALLVEEGSGYSTMESARKNEK
jgi:hypothetical protein